MRSYFYVSSINIAIGKFLSVDFILVVEKVLQEETVFFFKLLSYGCCSYKNKGCPVAGNQVEIVYTVSVLPFHLPCHTMLKLLSETEPNTLINLTRYLYQEIRRNVNLLSENQLL